MENFLSELSILLVITAVLSVIAVICKQPIIVAYVLCGILIGPGGFSWVKNIQLLEMTSHLGITLLLFLAGLNLHPQKLFQLFKETSFVTLTNCLASFALAFSLCLIYGFHLMDSTCISLALMFSSTILTVKLLPTTRLHHERMGAICIGILILQDLLAITVLVFMNCLVSPENALLDFVSLGVRLTAFIVVLIFMEKYVLQKIMLSVERLHEVLFILGLAWCFGIASISNHMGLFYETGAFFAGVIMARHLISRFIADKLRPLRDFFLVLFFFTLGAKLDFSIMKHVFLYGVILTVFLMLAKSWVFKETFILTGEKGPFAGETGVRLGQMSEFGLLIALLAFDIQVISKDASQLIQLVVILSFIVSSYLVVYLFPTPIGISEKLIKD